MADAKIVLRTASAKRLTLTQPNSKAPLSQRRHRTPTAPTWAIDDSTWLSRCPFCDGFHQHGNPGGERLPAWRLAHCGGGDSYRLVAADTPPPDDRTIEKANRTARIARARRTHHA
jgi:hypothetical protein